MVVSFIGGGNRRNRRKAAALDKIVINCLVIGEQ
jgi:hypothetical protein